MNIAILDDYQGVALNFADWDVLGDGAAVTVFRDHLAEPAAVVARLAPFDVVCVLRERTPLPGVILEQLPRLRLIASTTMRNASIDMTAARQLGIMVCGTGSPSLGAPVLTWALILALLRHVPGQAWSVAQGGWQTAVGGDLQGRTLGVLGLGKVGAMVARVGQAFGMRVVAWSPNLTAERAAQHGVALVAKTELFETADILTIHLVLSDRSRGIVGADELALMRPSALLINTSRGPLVDEAALIDALRLRRIGGAALDVFAVEPLPSGHPFRLLDNVLATPHIGFVTEDTLRMFYRETVENIRAWRDGAPIRVLNP
ncbi:MAG: D-2-hydroxyacid dehydrogenase family protein [Vicinamibacterales bacterium]